MGEEADSWRERKRRYRALCWVLAGAVFLESGALPPALRTGSDAPHGRDPTAWQTYASWQAESIARGAAIVQSAVTVLATGYCACAKCCGRSADGMTATGQRAVPGIVAVDPAFIPLNTRLYIEGYGYAIAGDTGSAIRGPHVDLFFDTHRKALSYGRQWVKVYVVPSASLAPGRRQDAGPQPPGIASP